MPLKIIFVFLILWTKWESHAFEYIYSYIINISAFSYVYCYGKYFGETFPYAIATKQSRNNKYTSEPFTRNNNCTGLEITPEPRLGSPIHVVCLIIQDNGRHSFPSFVHTKDETHSMCNLYNVPAIALTQKWCEYVLAIKYLIWPTKYCLYK